MYLLLDEEGQDRIALDRLLALEREHCSLVLRIAEMDGIGVPADAPGRTGYVHDLHSIEAAINWHRERRGVAAPRVEAEDDGQTGDDGADSRLPVGEETPK